ncbi:hypothetical protein [Nocardia terpenica]|nr:hypothetical protein [Nocardia terpenica]NQE89577.1 hypothetical protein [Nocardia terpenica]
MTPAEFVRAHSLVPEREAHRIQDLITETASLRQVGSAAKDLVAEVFRRRGLTVWAAFAMLGSSTREEEGRG